MIEKKYTIVEDQHQLESLVNHIEEHDYFAFDTETTGLNVRKERVIGFSLSGEPGKAFYLPIETWDSGKEKLIEVWNREIVNDLLLKLKEKELIMWNASFDIRVVKNFFGIDYTDNLIADAMLLKHTLEEEGDFALKKVAIQNQEALGLDMEAEANKEQVELKENVKKNGGSTTRVNYEMFKADLDVMGKYAAADADLTLRIALLYREQLEKENLEDFFYRDEVMPLYKEVTIPMEELGVKLDMPLIKQAKLDIVKDLETLEQEIINELFDLKEVQQWYENMLSEKYPAKKSGSFGQKLVEYFDLPLPKTASGRYSLTAANIKKYCKSCRPTGFLMGVCNIDPAQIYEIQDLIHLEKQGRRLNISSKKQMGEIVFDYLNIEPLSTTKKGAPQFNDAMIQHLVSEGYSWAIKLSNYNKLIKIQGAYIDRFLDNHENGYYYFSYKQHGTISGRYGSDAQQLPRPKEEGELHPKVLKYNNLIRQFFIAEDDCVFIDCDYESLEPHVFAHVSGDEGLRDIFRNGHDFYSTIAIKTEKLEGVSPDKKADNYLGKVNKPLRQKAKAYCLGIPYGMEAFKLGVTLGLDKEEASELIDGYLNGFPALKKWMEDSNKHAKIHGYIKSEAGRVRHLPKVQNLYKKYGDKLLEWKFRKHLEKTLDKDEVLGIFRDYKNGLNNSKNFQIQSMSASIVNRAAIATMRKFKELGIEGQVVAQVHDQLIFQVKKEFAKTAKDVIQSCMEQTTTLSIDLKAPPEIGTNWMEAH